MNYIAIIINMNGKNIILYFFIMLIINLINNSYI